MTDENPKISDMPLISVIIPSYNCAQFVREAVTSALAQTYSPLEVIVVDDGSTDDTKKRLDPFMGRVRYVYQPKGGAAKARNRGIKEARGQLIAFLDADDQWLPEKLFKQWKCLRAHPEAPLVHTDVYNVNEPLRERVYEYRGRERYSGYCCNEFFWHNRVNTSSVLVTRRCLEQVGLFDEEIRLRASVEDFDLWLRIARHFPFSYIDEPLVLYRSHSTNSTRSLRMMLEDEYYVFAKALSADSAIWNGLGQDRIRRRMAALAFQSGYANVEAGDLRRARNYFREALGYDPQALKTWAFWTSTFLPAGLRKRLRALKQRLTPQENVI